jgi:hypothetical protein
LIDVEATIEKDARDPRGTAACGPEELLGAVVDTAVVGPIVVSATVVVGAIVVGATVVGADMVGDVVGQDGAQLILLLPPMVT